ncbi:MAG: GNAT family N-acetyltransferase [Clostridiales bacterium]|nr:GNAT family N-acetyltransferase [Clostridiales bacterium]
MKGVIKMDTIQIQAYSAKDEVSLISMTTRVEAYKVLMSLPRANMLVAKYNDKTVGYASYSENVSKAFVYVYVHPACYHMHIGNLLYQAIENRCRQKGVKQVYACARKESFIDDEHFDYTFEYVRMEYQKPQKNSFACSMPERAAIRKYRDDDFEGCNHILSSIGYRQNADNYYSFVQTDGGYQQCKDDFFVLDLDETVTGCGRIRDNRIDLVAVDPAKTGCGCGRALLAYMTRQILKKGHSRAFLWCEATNERVRTFYEKNGYRPCYVACWPVKQL